MRIRRYPYADIMSVHPGVTGSLNLIVVKFPDGKSLKFIADCGMFQGRDVDQDAEDPNKTLPFNSDTIDFALVTHNHIDHTGRLPLIVKNGFRNEIYLTESTGKLIRHALDDSCHVIRDTSKRRHCKPLYTETDVDLTEQLLKPLPYNETIKIKDNVSVTFLKNGHLMGAAMILVQISYPETEDINLLFTGDYNNKNMFFDVPDIPEWILDLPLIVIQESTYGDMNSTEIKPCFASNVAECIRNNGTVIAPVFSLGRAQEILYILKNMQKEGLISTDIPIYLDGKLAIKYTGLYLNDGLDIKEDMRDFLPENYKPIFKKERGSIIHNIYPKIVLTTSGMGSYGPAQIYIPEYITRRNALIHFTGYASPDSLGGRLKAAKIGDDVEVAGLYAKKGAEVEFTNEFSAHAKADEMIAFLKKFKNLKLVLVNHGEPEKKDIFSRRILDEVDTKYVGILGKDYFFRVNPYGLEKTLSVKFK